ncbi:hypothetical protein [Bacillus sp. V5-8f]|uniref:hypothetical protein n=1 Tax=Bacillus sp. V5-8f TaxID=2053044 RepID=UPI000C78115B|nr:hypothetical protein [Bacillus sp. V5-8f]PLT33704.1 hypothetical protein CUU64_11320 [Bacillus sp. V5-8f]
MLTFEEKIKIIESFPELERKDVSLGRVNFHFAGSVHEKKLVVQHLHPNGNGFVYAGHLPKKEKYNKGFVNIREYSESKLRQIVKDSISYLSILPVQETGGEENTYQDVEGIWVGPGRQELIVANEDLLWNVYSGINLEECFESPVEATRYLREEGFRRKM